MITTKLEIFKTNFTKIRIERALKNWTKSELTQKAGISRKTLKNIEDGTAKKVNIKTIEKVAKALEKPVEYFLEK